MSLVPPLPQLVMMSTSRTVLVELPYAIPESNQTMLDYSIWVLTTVCCTEVETNNLRLVTCARRLSHPRTRTIFLRCSSNTRFCLAFSSSLANCCSGVKMVPGDRVSKSRSGYRANKESLTNALEARCALDDCDPCLGVAITCSISIIEELYARELPSYPQSLACGRRERSPEASW